MKFLLLFTISLAAVAADTDGTHWNPQSAASYLDGRAAWWITWKNSARDHDTFCISCHTALPYAIGRPALRTALGEKGASKGETQLVDNVTKRVRMWADVEPF